MNWSILIKPIAGIVLFFSILYLISDIDLRIRRHRFQKHLDKLDGRRNRN